MTRLLVLFLFLAPLSGCTLCWPRGGSMGHCVEPDDDDDDSGDDDDATGDDDDSTGFDCLSRRIRPTTFETVDAFGYGTVSSETADLPFCWFDATQITQLTANMHTAGATHGHERVEWDVEFYGEIAPTVRIDVNGALVFDYQGAHNPNNECDFYASWDEPAVAVFWDNLNMTDDGAGEIRYDTIGEEGDRIAVAWWDGVFHDDFPGEPLSFQVHLFEADHHIEVHYQTIEHSEWDINYGRSATIGLRHELNTDELLWSCNENRLRNGTVIAYWPPE